VGDRASSRPYQVLELLPHGESPRRMAAPYGRAVQTDSFYSSATALIASSYMTAKISSKLGALSN
jgi:hypothetical protein